VGGDRDPGMVEGKREGNLNLVLVRLTIEFPKNFEVFPTSFLLGQYHHHTHTLQLYFSPTFPLRSSRMILLGTLPLFGKTTWEIHFTFVFNQTVPLLSVLFFRNRF
jgi:hypothetical protein